MARQSTLVRVRLDGDNSGAIGVPSNHSPGRVRSLQQAGLIWTAGGLWGQKALARRTRVRSKKEGAA